MNRSIIISSSDSLLDQISVVLAFPFGFIFWLAILSVLFVFSFSFRWPNQILCNYFVPKSHPHPDFGCPDSPKALFSQKSAHTRVHTNLRSRSSSPGFWADFGNRGEDLGKKKTELHNRVPNMPEIHENLPQNHEKRQLFARFLLNFGKKPNSGWDFQEFWEIRHSFARESES